MRPNRAALTLIVTCAVASPASAGEGPFASFLRAIERPSAAFAQPLPLPTIKPGPESTPLPRLRPAPATSSVLGVLPIETTIVTAELPPVNATLDTTAPPPRPRLAPPPPAKPVPTREVALAAPTGLGKPLAPFANGECGIANPVKVSVLDGVTLTPAATLDTTTAATLRAWLRDSVQLEATARLGAPVTGLRVAASYACRNRDNLPDAKLSEHARGKAVDIAAFRVRGRWITVGANAQTPAEVAFLAALRMSACGPFTTVLGPGADEFHTDHFHLDLAARRTAGPSHGLYCH